MARDQAYQAASSGAKRIRTLVCRSIFRGDAMPRFLLVLLPLVLTAQTVLQPGVPGTVEGRVTNAVTGEPINGATVNLYSVNGRGAAAVQPQSGSSQSDGVFHFDSVPQGSYLVVSQASGFSSGRGYSPRQRITVGSGQQVTGVFIQLSPQGSISGKVLDEEGKPLGHARVQTYSTYTNRGKLQLRRNRSTTTNEAGEYTLSKLDSGRYFVSAEYQGGEKEKEAAESAAGAESIVPVLVRTFFPKSLDYESATPIQVSAGQDAGDTSIQLRRVATYRVEGRVAESNPGGLQKGATVMLSPENTLDSDVLGQKTRINSDGTFEFRRVLPGSYTLWLTGRYDESGPANHGRGTRLLGRQQVEVAASDVSGIVLGLTPPINLTGRVTGANVNAESFGNLRVNLAPGGDVAFGISQNAAVAADGSFSIQNLMPGTYFVHVMNMPVGVYVKEVSLNRHDIEITGMDLSQGGGGEIEILLSTGAGEVDGTLGAENSAGVSSMTMAVLVPESLPEDGSGVLVSSAPNGTFSFRNVPPGHYYAFAAERWTSLWQNSEFLREMRRASTAVDLAENGRVQVQVPVLSSEDIGSTAERLGLNFQ